ncbi:hypothetical protein HMPREF0765_1757 [Sphingobacterium spiritivorum ATCC 33300]|uniref:Uncharacterized protein n=1 Tax=Sphingobacterium spiritivorum ATCC 33300 TaxID=525372 RepID=C2FWQ1_SPHSI|nr:hypothetical protein [Sphingobacterium spiritivorum]EEI92665.1 hypothetical protein HMPREF0765_1757 [Sphingobacterium spiritivorum ATCC 33300]QQS94145.1 hypothetical protein I6J03_12065 [Sphingobacterium spiritivorum]
MNRPFSLLLSLLFAIFSCKEAKDDTNPAFGLIPIDMTANKATSIDPELEKLAKGNAFINIDVNYFKQNTSLQNPKISPEERKKLKAVAYRLYSNIVTNNNKMTLKAKSGAEIGISEEIYTIFNSSIEEANRYTEQYSKDPNYHVPSISENYLESLLK